MDFRIGLILLLTTVFSCKTDKKTSQDLKSSDIITIESKSEKGFDKHFDLTSFKIDSMNNYGAGDCWGNVRQYSNSNIVIGIDTMICSEYSTSFTKLLFINGLLRKAHIKNSNTLLDLNGLDNKYILTETKIDLSGDYAIYHSRVDTLDKLDFKLLKNDFKMVQSEILENHIKSLINEYNGLWEMEEEY